MTLPTHLMAGLVLGKITGNYSLSLAGAVLVDADHIFSYTKAKILFRPKELWRTLTDKNDPYGDQRYFLHNFFVFILITGTSAFINLQTGLIVGLAYLSHLILDALDDADYFPFFPNKKINLRGPIGYFSKSEFVFALFLLLIYALI